MEEEAWAGALVAEKAFLVGGRLHKLGEGRGPATVCSWPAERGADGNMLKHAAKAGKVGAGGSDESSYILENVRGAAAGNKVGHYKLAQEVLFFPSNSLLFG